MLNLGFQTAPRTADLEVELPPGEYQVQQTTYRQQMPRGIQPIEVDDLPSAQPARQRVSRITPIEVDPLPSTGQPPPTARQAVRLTEIPTGSPPRSTIYAPSPTSPPPPAYRAPSPGGAGFYRAAAGGAAVGGVVDFGMRVASGQPASYAAGGAAASTAGSFAGAVVGGAIGGPVGAFVGGAIGGWAGGALYDYLNKPPESAEHQPANYPRSPYSQNNPAPTPITIRFYSNNNYAWQEWRVYWYFLVPPYAAVPADLGGGVNGARWAIYALLEGAQGPGGVNLDPDTLTVLNPGPQNSPKNQGDRKLPDGGYPYGIGVDPNRPRYMPPPNTGRPPGENSQNSNRGKDLPQYAPPSAYQTPSPNPYDQAQRGPQHAGTYQPQTYPPQNLPQPQRQDQSQNQEGYQQQQHQQPNAFPDTNPYRQPSPPPETQKPEEPPPDAQKPPQPKQEKKESEKDPDLEEIKKRLDKLDFRTEEMAKLLVLVPMLAKLLGDMKKNAEANAPGTDNFNNAVGSAACGTLNAGGCFRKEFDEVGDAQKAGNGMLNNLSNKFNAFAQGLDLALLGVINEKLGPLIPGGISGRLLKVFGGVQKLWDTLQVNKALIILSWIGILHNALMLSNNLLSTLFGAVDIWLDAIGLKFTKMNEEGQLEDVDAQEFFNTWTLAFANRFFGAENVARLNLTWKKANRIYQAATNITDTLQGMFDSARQIAEDTAGNVGKIGNALKRAGLVFENAYDWMQERVTARSARQKKFDEFLQGLTKAEDILSTIDSIGSNVVDFQDGMKELAEARKEFTEAQTAAQKFLKDQSEAEKQASKSPEIDDLSFTIAPQTKEDE